MINIENEIWKDIPGYEGLYQVSSLGRIKNVRKTLRDHKLLIPKVNAYGYYYTNLSKEGILKTIRIHRVVAECFVENINNKKTVNHIDGNKLNNDSSNLEWLTSQENTQHALENGLCSKKLIKSRLNRSKNGENNTVGVVYNKGACKWIGYIWINGKYNHLGCFDSEKDAIDARKSALVKYGFATIEELNNLSI